MKLEDKPKCRGCGEKGNDTIYLYQPEKRGKGGWLWHYRCWEETANMIGRKQ